MRKIKGNDPECSSLLITRGESYSSLLIMIMHNYSAKMIMRDTWDSSLVIMTVDNITLSQGKGIDTRNRGRFHKANRWENPDYQYESNAY